MPIRFPQPRAPGELAPDVFFALPVMGELRLDESPELAELTARMHELGEALLYERINDELRTKLTVARRVVAASNRTRDHDVLQRLEVHQKLRVRHPATLDRRRDTPEPKPARRFSEDLSRFRSSVPLAHSDHAQTAPSQSAHPSRGQNRSRPEQCGVSRGVWFDSRDTLSGGYGDHYG